MPGGWEMSMMWMAMPGQSIAGAAFTFLIMWLAMMIAMMLPSSWPMLELYQKVAAVSSGVDAGIGGIVAQLRSRAWDIFMRCGWRSGLSCSARGSEPERRR